MTTGTSPGTLVQRRVLRDDVYDVILEMLLSGRAAPGEALAIEGLARDLGVSPTPVREALVQLEHTGLVTRAALKGYRASVPLSRERMGKLMEARAVIEVAAVRRAVPVEADVIAELETISGRHRAAAGDVLAMVGHSPEELDWATFRAYYWVDWDFHLVFLRNCDNPYLLESAQALAPHVQRLRQSMNHGTVDVEQAVAEHATILEAVGRGDTEGAAAAMQAHLEAVRVRAMSDFR